MIVVNEQPGSIVFTKNPVLVRTTSVDGVGAPLGWRGIRTTLVVVGYEEVPEGEGFVLNWTEPSGLSFGVGFGAQLFPVLPNEIPSSSAGFPSIVAYWQHIAGIVQAHPLIAPFFLCFATDTGAGTALTLEVRESRELAWVVGWNDFSLPSLDSSVVDVTEPSSTIPENYRVTVEVFLEQTYGGGDYVFAGRASSPVDAAGQCAFNISSILDSAATLSLQDDLQGPGIPPWAADKIRTHSVQRSYYLRVSEQETSTEVAYTDIVVIDGLRCHVGGIAQQFFSEGDFWEALDDENAFLTWTPDEKPLAPSQPEWLAWINHTNVPIEIIVQVVQYNIANAATATYVFDEGPDRLVAQPYEVLLIPVRPTTLGVVAASVRFEVQVVDAESRWEDGEPTYLSQVRSYEVDRRHYHTVRYIMYHNAFTCPETLRCLGDAVVDMESEVEVSQRVRVPGNTASYGEEIALPAIWRDTFTYHTSYMRPVDMEALRELFIVRNAYEVFASGYVPLVIPGAVSLPVSSSRRNLHSYSFTARPAIFPRNYSGQLQVVPPSYWLTIDELAWTRVFGRPWQTT